MRVSLMNPEPIGSTSPSSISWRQVEESRVEGYTKFELNGSREVTQYDFLMG